jgi:hypothetical protein
VPIAVLAIGAASAGAVTNLVRFSPFAGLLGDRPPAAMLFTRNRIDNRYLHIDQ